MPQEERSAISQAERVLKFAKRILDGVLMAEGEEESVFKLVFRADDRRLGDLGRVLLQKLRVAHFPAPSEFLCPERIPKRYEVFYEMAPTWCKLEDCNFVTCVPEGGEPVDGHEFREKALLLSPKLPGLVDADRWLKEWRKIPLWLRDEDKVISFPGTVLLRQTNNELFIPVIVWHGDHSDLGGRYMLRLQKVEDRQYPQWSDNNVVPVFVGKEKV